MGLRATKPHRRVVLHARELLGRVQTTAAEMSKEEKNAISHRSKALQKLKSWLESNS